MDPEEKMSLLDRLIEKFSNSRFFTISFVLHVLLIAIFGGTVLFEAMQEPPDFEGGEGGFLAAGEPAAAPPAPSQAQPQETTFTVSTPSMQNSTVAAITTTGQNPLNFSMDAIITPTTMVKPAATTSVATAAPVASVGAAGMSAEVAKQIGAFTGGWGKGTGSGTGTRQREFSFTAYVAKYSGGNWDSTVDLRGGKIWRGSLPNILEFMSKESKDKVKTDYRNVEAIPLDSDKLFSVKPPFIFFTGSRDFKLSDKEVENLQKYVRLGGAIWGDSSVPGRGSRFDIAFRREMKRVIPDKDKDFEELDVNDPMFRRAPYFPEIKKQPAGINYYEEPVYVMRYFGEIAVIYTANDYADMWQFGVKLDEKSKKWVINNDRDENGVRVAMDWDLYVNSGIYIHNTDPNPPITSILDTYKFGTNMIIHLLTRWEDKLRTAPRL
ncbi:MAG: DUF4159 domain-containing protein [Chthoniobacterales bacterium]|nr:DUF4159 domain-containing protein [Chthoniobacterales bacterium]